jgi:hypothetical protein
LSCLAWDPTKVSKVLARKRRRLRVIDDSVVAEVLGTQGKPGSPFGNDCGRTTARGTTGCCRCGSRQASRPL